MSDQPEPAAAPAVSTATDLMVTLQAAGADLGKLCALRVRYARPGLVDLDGLEHRLTYVRARVAEGRLVPGQD